MRIYNVIWEDRHTDITATPFRDLEEAKAWAKKQAKKHADHDWEIDKDWTSEVDQEIGGWLYYVRYNDEGDCLWITDHYL